jgi:RNA polymerase sigma-70 factor (ECF subfamily)
MAKGRKPAKYLTHDEDKALVIQALSGETGSAKAYDLLVQKYKPILYTAVRRRLGNSITEEEVEDIVMFTMGRAFIGLHTYDPEKSKLFTWMISCVHNHMNSLYRSKKRVSTESYHGIPTVGIEALQVPDPDDADAETRVGQLMKLMRMLIEKLPPDVAEAVKLKYLKDYSYEEIAEELGCKVGDVWYKLSKGKKLLKRYSDRLNLF